MTKEPTCRPESLPDRETSEWFGPEERQERFTEVTLRMMGFPPSKRLRPVGK